MRTVFRSIAFLTLMYALLVNVAGADQKESANSSHGPSIASEPHDDQETFVTALRARLALEKEQLESLHQQLLAETDPVKATEIQRQVRSAKIETEIALLQLQLDRAATVGKSDLAEELRQAIEALKNPQPRNPSGFVVGRPAPARNQ